MAAGQDVDVLARWVPGETIIREGSDGLSRADRFAPPVRRLWQLSPALQRHWGHVYGAAPEMPHYEDVGQRLRDLLAQRARDPSSTASICVPDWPTAGWWPLLRRFRADKRYDAGAPALVLADDLDTIRPLRHPLLVLRLPAPGEKPLSKTQRRVARSVARSVAANNS